MSQRTSAPSSADAGKFSPRVTRSQTKALSTFDASDDDKDYTLRQPTAATARSLQMHEQSVFSQTTPSQPHATSDSDDPNPSPALLGSPPSGPATLAHPSPRRPTPPPSFTLLNTVFENTDPIPTPDRRPTTDPRSPPPTHRSSASAPSESSSPTLVSSADRHAAPVSPAVTSALPATSTDRHSTTPVLPVVSSAACAGELNGPSLCSAGVTRCLKCCTGELHGPSFYSAGVTRSSSLFSAGVTRSFTCYFGAKDDFHFSFWLHYFRPPSRHAGVTRAR